MIYSKGDAVFGRHRSAATSGAYPPRSSARRPGSTKEATSGFPCKKFIDRRFGARRLSSRSEKHFSVLRVSCAVSRAAARVFRGLAVREMSTLSPGGTGLLIRKLPEIASHG